MTLAELYSIAEAGEQQFGTLTNAIGSVKAQIGTILNGEKKPTPAKAPKKAKHGPGNRALTEAQADRLLELQQAGWTYERLAQKFGVSPYTVASVIWGRGPYA
jgi:hypothetical protein